MRAGAGTRYDPQLAAEMIALYESQTVPLTLAGRSGVPGVVGALEQRSIVRGTSPRPI